MITKSISNQSFNSQPLNTHYILIKQTNSTFQYLGPNRALNSITVPKLRTIQTQYNHRLSYFSPMKKMKYLLLKTHKEKSKLHQNHTHSHYLNAIKHQAIKSLQNFEQNCLNQTQLNITLTSQRANSQYRSKSDQKQNLQKTFHSKPSPVKPSNHNQSAILQASAINIRKLLRQNQVQKRLKTEVQQKQTEKLRNPFYKIQKVRELPKKLSMTDKHIKILTKQNNSLNLKNEKESNEIHQKDNQLCFISRQKRQWYFASRKFRSRTVQQDQIISINKKRQQAEQKMPQPLLMPEESQEKQDLFCPKVHEKNFGQFAQFQTIEQLNSRQEPKVRFYDENEAVRQNETEGNAFLRQRSLTVKYNEIKDYFERKYNKSNLNQYQDDKSQGYQEQKRTNHE